MKKSWNYEETISGGTISKGCLMRDYFFPDLRKRNTADKEILDGIDVDLRRLQRTIRQFKLVNVLFSFSGRLMHKHFFHVMVQNPGRTYTLLDIGAGGGRYRHPGCSRSSETEITSINYSSWKWYSRTPLCVSSHQKLPGDPYRWGKCTGSKAIGQLWFHLFKSYASSFILGWYQNCSG